MRIIITCFLLTFLTSVGGSQTAARYRTLSATDGLPNPNVCFLLQDQKDYVWIGTLNGIARYDGQELRTYRPNFAADPETPPRDFPFLQQGQGGNIWLGYVSRPEIWQYDAARDTFTVVCTLPVDSLSGKRPTVRAVHEDEEGHLWVSTAGHGIIRYHISAGSVDTCLSSWYSGGQQNPRGLPTDFMAPGIWKQENGQLNFLTEAGLAIYQPANDTFINKTWTGSDSSNELLDYAPDPALQSVWLATFGGLIRYDYARDTFYQYGAPDTTGAPLITNLVLTKTGRLYASIGSFPYSSIWRVDRKTATFSPLLAERNGRYEALPGVLDIIEDQQGHLWSANFVRGIQIIDLFPTGPKRVVLPQLTATKSSIDDLGITAISETKPGTFYLGTNDKGIWCWQPQQKKLYPLAGKPKEHPQWPRILGITPELNGTILWVSTEKGIYEYNLRNNSVTHNDPMPEKAKSELREVYNIENQYWARIRGGGIFCLDSISRRWTAVRLTPDSPVANPKAGLSLPVNSGTVIRGGASSQSVFIGTIYNGILEYNLAADTLIHHLPGYSINDLLVSPDNMLWVASTAGLIRYNPLNQKKSEDKKNVLAEHPFPQQLRLGGDSVIWVVSRNGFSALDWRNVRTIHKLEAADWLPAGQNWDEGKFSFLKTKGRHFLTANANGIFFLDPKEIPVDSFTPQIHLNGLFIDGRQRPFPIASAEPLELSYRDNHLSFNLSSPFFPVAKDITIHFQLKGFDGAERITTTNLPLEYPKLPAGDYELLTRSQNANGTFGPRTSLARFTINPPWYANSLAYLVYFLLGGAFLYWLYSTQLRRKEQLAEQRYLRELDIAKTNLFTNISHEFRTPLTLILGEAALLSDRVNGLLASPLQRIRHSGARLLWLVEQLLELARADSGFLKIELGQGDIIPFLRYNLHAFASLADPKDITLDFRTHLTQLEMDFDPERLQRILSNLLANAINYTPEGGRVELIVDLATHGLAGISSLHSATSSDKKTLEISVSDTGPGIPAAELPLIFDRFHRATREGGGAGIGLALANELAKAMQGTLTASNGEESGAIFQLALPVNNQAPALEGAYLLESPLIATDRKVEDVVPSILTNEVANGALKQLLIIEDDEDLRQYISAALRGNKTYRLTLARDGVEGLELANDQDFDLIISDVMMPRMNGFEVCARLKEQFTTSHIPIILLTARADQDSRITGFKSGADAYLTKPFSPIELTTRCQQLLEQRHRSMVYFQQILGSASPLGTAATSEKEGSLDFIIRARLEVEKQLGNEAFGPLDLAKSLQISRSQLHRKLNQLAGLSTTHFIRKVRLTQAEYLLIHSSQTIAEIAYQCGFRDPNYFSRVFREVYELSPSEFRRKPLEEQ